MNQLMRIQTNKFSKAAVIDICQQSVGQQQSELFDNINKCMEKTKGSGIRKIRHRMGANYHGISDAQVARVLEKSTTYQKVKARFGNRAVLNSELRTQNNLFRSVRPGDSTLRLVRVAIMRVTLCIHIYSTNAVYLRNTRGGRHSNIHSNIHCLGSLRIIVIILH